MDAADLGLNLQAMHLDHALALLRQFPMKALGQALTNLSPKAAALICQVRRIPAVFPDSLLIIKM